MSIAELQRGFEERSFALLVGIDRYESDELPALACAAKDVASVRDALVSACGYAADNVRVLVDERATRKALLKALRDMGALVAARRRLPGEARTRFLFYFAGHGLATERGGAAQTVLAMHETDPEIADTGLGRDELSNALDGIGADQSVVILDCCHAGGLRGARGAERLPLDRFVQAMRETKGTATLSSCREDEVAYERKDGTNSVFAGALVAGLTGGADTSSTGAVFLEDLTRYLDRHVPEIARAERNRAQTPVAHTTVSGGSLLFAVRRQVAEETARLIEEGLIRVDGLRASGWLAPGEVALCKQLLRGAPHPPGSPASRQLATLLDVVRGGIDDETLRAYARRWTRGEATPTPLPDKGKEAPIPEGRDAEVPEAEPTDTENTDTEETDTDTEETDTEEKAPDVPDATQDVVVVKPPAADAGDTRLTVIVMGGLLGAAVIFIVVLNEVVLPWAKGLLDEALLPDPIFALVEGDGGALVEGDGGALVEGDAGAPIVGPPPLGPWKSAPLRPLAELLKIEACDAGVVEVCSQGDKSGIRFRSCVDGRLSDGGTCIGAFASSRCVEGQMTTVPCASGASHQRRVCKGGAWEDVGVCVLGQPPP